MFYWRWFNRRHHPLSRLIFGAVGLVLFAVVLALGFFALIAFALVGAIVAITRGVSRPQQAGNQPSGNTNVIEGEFVVLPSQTASIKH
jgi:membrane protein implicated in regulation of membrane protease activity